MTQGDLRFGFYALIGILGGILVVRVIKETKGALG